MAFLNASDGGRCLMASATYHATSSRLRGLYLRSFPCPCAGRFPCAPSCLGYIVVGDAEQDCGATRRKTKTHAVTLAGPYRMCQRELEYQRNKRRMLPLLGVLNASQLFQPHRLLLGGQPGRVRGSR